MKKHIILYSLAVLPLITFANEKDTLDVSLDETIRDTISTLDSSTSLVTSDVLVSDLRVDRPSIEPIYKELFTSEDIVSFDDDRIPVDEELFKYHVSTKEFSVPMEYNHLVKAQIDYFGTRWQSKLKQMVTKSQYFFPYYEEVLSEFDMPLEIKFLSIIESGLNPYAYSRAGAAGAWQFMPVTGRIFDLDINRSVDERRSVEKSTRAACTYLKQMYNQYDDWLVALAAYNCGPGNVRKAMRHSGKSDFWGMYNYLPRETKNYVPKFIAMTYMMTFYDQYGITAAPVDGEYFNYETVFCKKGLDFDVIAERVGITSEQLRKYNPELKTTSLPVYINGYQLNIPFGTADLFYSSLDDIYAVSLVKLEEKRIAEANKPKVIYHYVRKGECLPIIARKYDCSVSQLKSWNGIRGTIIYPKQKLKIYRS